MRDPEDVTNMEYTSFYKSLSRIGENHLAVKHFCVSGQLEFRALLFVPLPGNTSVTGTGLKLFVRHSFVMDDCDELLPDWLSMVTGVVDAKDLPFNNSRDALKDSEILALD